MRKNIFIPLKSIGNFFLEDKIEKYFSTCNFKHTSVDTSTGWETYSLDDEGIALFTEDGKIISILTDGNCFYKDINIIGMNFGTNN